jgi:hypothetical protein
MFSLDRFYNILHNNLISKFTNGRTIFYYPFGTYEYRTFLSGNSNTVESAIAHFTWPAQKSWVHCYCFDQEPYYDYTLPIIKNSQLNPAQFSGPGRLNILANSEKSNLKNNFVKQNAYYDWYYFFHGFAALDWYRDFQYLESSVFDRFDKVFICYNHLLSKYRSYRLHLVSNLIQHNLVQHGHVSFFLKDTTGTWQQELDDPDCLLDSQAKSKIQEFLPKLDAPLIIDTVAPHGSLSASVNIDQLTSALFHVVTETVYFQDKLHLTEKVFKPIVARRPFFLVATPGNLAYLRSYGFRTFDRWIDESYDEEPDHYVRIEKITAELARLCAMDKSALEQMYREMQDTLEYNFNHFYGSFKQIIVDELVDNFAGVLSQVNNGRQPGNHSRYHQRFELDAQYLEQVKKRLCQ